MLFIPALNFAPPAELPSVSAHTFYEHRQADIDDGVPKHVGYLRSQSAIVTLSLQAFGLKGS